MSDLQLKDCQLSDRYDVRAQLGRGSYAEIYVAKDILASPESPHEFVVIKALNVFMQNDLDHDLELTLVENFQNEALALDKVRHPNIISRLGHGTARDLRGTVFHYLVLEYMPGGDLSKYCRNQKLSVDQCLDYLEQICAGISHAHKKEVIHRDIKPQNLLLTENKKVVKIGDFGVARFTESNTPITRVGTNVYAPPEHSPLLTGETQNLAYSELTPAADIYSIAKSTFVLFTSESPRFVANQPITELPFAFRREPWTEGLLKVLERATQKDPRNRYQDVNDFWKDLSELRSLSEVSVKTSVAKRKTASPQPQYAEGYSPNTPIRPKFNTSRELKLKPHVTVGQNLPLVVEINEKDPLLKPKPKPKSEPVTIDDHAPIQPLAEVPLAPPRPKQQSKLRRMAAVFIILAGLVGSLYATYNYFLNSGFSVFGTTTSRRIGVATTDINLRSAPTTANTPIGLVTKNSRLEVVNVEDNWYQIVILKHGREKSDPNEADRGWAYGKYIDLDE